QVEERQASETALRKTQVGGGDRSEKIRTYNFPQDRITDHRIGQSWHSINRIMDGELDEVLAALKQAERDELKKQ
ncbi:MAG: peptide chain release factor 1, partial [Patescibacteria group bacterium]